MQHHLTIKQLSERLGIDPSTLYKQKDRLGIPYVKVGGAVRFDPAKVQKWLDLHEVNAEPTIERRRR